MDSPLQSFKFPRTGKRGVPQQFPRRLYEMLDGETKLMESSEDQQYHVIHWSTSGRAFRIADAHEFAESVLPKYFRTKKFSSFQRNLNLYGFTKVRRGPDVDMYAHPSFLRDRPELLLDLRKINGNNRKRGRQKHSYDYDRRAVSPSPSHSTGSEESSSWPPSSPIGRSEDHHLGNLIAGGASLQESPTGDRGKLDLLAFALEQMD